MAAGGYKEFVAGETLDQDEINDYLMQGMLVFAGTAARGSAIGTPVEGQFSYLSDTDAVEFYDGSAWTALATTPLTLEWIVVAGGGGGYGDGGARGGSGGGAGGFRTSGREGAITKAIGDSFTVTVGAGGAGTLSTEPGKGVNSVFDTITSEGGGRGGWTSGTTGGTGGSSGGGFTNQTYQYPLTPDGVANTAGARQGNQGCKGMVNNSEPGGAGGGAGGEATTGDWVNNVGSSGGQGVCDGIISDTLATAESVGEVVGGFVFYGGGGAGNAGTTGGTGGIGGGGDSPGGAGAGAAGQANTGGGGAGASNTGNAGGNGGSGLVILSLPSNRSLTVGAGLTYANDQENDRNIYIFKSGTGTVTVA